MAQSNISREKDFRSKVLKYFVNGKATLKYREIAKLAGCSLGMVSYYKDPERAIQRINENSGRTEWHKVWAYLFRSRGNKKIIKETFTTLLRKKGRAFLYGCKRYPKGETYMSNKEKLKHKGISVKDCLNEIWPGIEVNEKTPKQSLHPHTKEWDFYEDGTPIMSPFTRSAITGSVINAKSNLTEVDHRDSDRMNNHPSNFSFSERYANMMKGELTYKELYERVCRVKEFLEKYV